ncbi:lectin-like [Stegastes partitus]|uniref:Lectin-like n=1 Tax=Stegastes partitus TaxID=144197 RepID=A0A9Y4JNP0_9TELE|nr:PREDICTED: lectin-like [Stegastes partitus]
MTWKEAQAFCRANQADLATVDSMEDHVRLLESINRTDVSVWLGLTKSKTKRWMWSEGIGTVTATRWRSTKFADDSYGVEHYTLHTKLMSWRAAQTFCRQHYTDLASETTEAQHVNVYRSGQHKYVWIGLFRDSWTWSDQSTGSFRNWHKGMPDDAGGRQNCARIATAFKNQWDDVSCANKYPFVCNNIQLNEDTCGGKRLIRFHLP